MNFANIGDASISAHSGRYLSPWNHSFLIIFNISTVFFSIFTFLLPYLLFWNKPLIDGCQEVVDKPLAF